MGIRYTRNKGSVGGESFFAMAAALQGIIVEELTTVGEDGVEEARSIVETSGTNREWVAPFQDRHGGERRSGSGAGRIDTGEMIDALGYRILHGRNVGLDVGWVDPNKWQDYFAAQDEGFSAGGYRSANQQVEGMHVMSHLREKMKIDVADAVDRIIERINNGL